MKTIIQIEVEIGNMNSVAPGKNGRAYLDSANNNIKCTVLNPDAIPGFTGKMSFQRSLYFQLNAAPQPQAPQAQVTPPANLADLLMPPAPANTPLTMDSFLMSKNMNHAFKAWFAAQKGAKLADINTQLASTGIKLTKKELDWINTQV